MSNLDFSKATCAKEGTDDSIFFPDFEDSVSTTRRKFTEAKEICGSCPLRMKCLQVALDQEEDYGVWGGVDETVLRRARFIDINGRSVRDRPSVICPNCQDESHSDLYAIENIGRTADVGCHACGLTWNVRKNLDIESPSF